MLADFPSSHTRLRQLGASCTGFYPSVILRSSFAQGSLGNNFEF